MEQNTGRAVIGRHLRRYWPFLAIVALQAFLVARPEQTSTEVVSSPQNAPANASGDTSGGDSTGALTASGQQAATGARNPSSPGTTVRGASGGTSPTGVTSAAATSGSRAAASAANGQPADPLGRPLSGDKGKCSADGLRQEAVTTSAPP